LGQVIKSGDFPGVYLRRLPPGGGLPPGRGISKVGFEID